MGDIQYSPIKLIKVIYDNIIKRKVLLGFLTGIWSVTAIGLLLLTISIYLFPLTIFMLIWIFWIEIQWMDNEVEL